MNDNKIVKLWNQVNNDLFEHACIFYNNPSFKNDYASIPSNQFRHLFTKLFLLLLIKVVRILSIESFIINQKNICQKILLRLSDCIHVIMMGKDFLKLICEDITLLQFFKKNDDINILKIPSLNFEEIIATGYYNGEYILGNDFIYENNLKHLNITKNGYDENVKDDDVDDDENINDDIAYDNKDDDIAYDNRDHDVVEDDKDDDVDDDAEYSDDQRHFTLRFNENS
jgi:hypothetical protein